MFRFTPYCCCNPPSCEANYGLQTLTTTDMNEYSSFMRGWNGEEFVGLRGNPGYPWFQTLVHSDGTLEYLTGLYLSNGFIDPLEAKTYPQELSDVILAGFQNCRRINFHPYNDYVYWLPFDYFIFSTRQADYGILPDSFSRRYIYTTILDQDIHLIQEYDAYLSIIEKRHINFDTSGKQLVAITPYAPLDDVGIVYAYNVSGLYTNIISSPLFNALNDYISFPNYHWGYGLEGTNYDTIVKHASCSYSIKNTTIKLTPENGYVVWDNHVDTTQDVMTRPLYYPIPHTQITTQPVLNDASQFISDYNSNPVYLPDLIQKTPDPDDTNYYITWFPSFVAGLRVYEWWATYNGS